ncbi:MAG: glycoside hydrolase family 19 protein [Methylococcales bacterium]|nr:glycoside hydrolase family 19 protein [Methylococcales bacterium]
MLLDNLKGHIPEQVLAQLPDVVAKFNINTELRLAHFLAQCAHESGGFEHVTENLNYSAEGLKKTFARHFSASESAAYAHHPERIGARAYANRMGNGNEASGDGYVYRGRGYIQLTGKDNYKAFAQFIGEDVIANPDLVATQFPLASAAFFFEANDLWDLCDEGATAAAVKHVTRRVNGGENGLPERIKLFNEFHRLLA